MSQTGRAQHLTERGVIKAFIDAERKQEGAASDLFKLAKKHGNLDAWEGALEEAEQFYLSDAAGQSKVQKLPRLYTQAKSDIRGGFRAGLDFSRIKSYHAMKKLKAAANADKSVTSSAPDPTPAADSGNVIVVGQDQAEPKTQSGDGEVIVVQAEGQRREGTRRAAGPRREREPKHVMTMEEALEAGLVLDARTNVVMPEDMRPLVAALSKMDEHTRARLVKRFTKEARDVLSRQGAERPAARRRRA